MTIRNDDIARDDAGRPLEEHAGDHASTLEKTFHLASETAQATAHDAVASGTRKPASDRVDEARVAQAQEQNAEADAKGPAADAKR